MKIDLRFDLLLESFCSSDLKPSRVY